MASSAPSLVLLSVSKPPVSINNSLLPPTNRVRVPLFRSRWNSVSVALPPRPLAVVAATAGRPWTPPPTPFLCTSHDRSIRVDPEQPILYDKAKFALDKFNGKKKANLQLVKVVAAATTATFAADGTYYYLSLQVKEDDIRMFYRVSVWERDDGFMSLTYFGHVYPDEDPRHVFSFTQELPEKMGPEYRMDKSSSELVGKLAKFAVSTYNAEEELNLQFAGAFGARCYEAEVPIWGRGTMYSMYLKIFDNGKQVIYRARICKYEDDDSLELEEFVPHF